MTAITNKILDPTGDPLAGVPVDITLMPGAAFRSGGLSEVARQVRVLTDATGEWTADLDENATLTPSGTYYRVVERIPGAERSYNIQVGSTPTTLLAALISTPPSVPVTQYLTQAAGDARYVQSPGTFGGAVDITTVTPGDTADAGSEDSYARIDHRHAMSKVSNGDLATGFRLHGSSASAPSSPSRGDTWLDTDTMELFVYYGATTGWQKPWNMPWGRVAGTVRTANLTSIGAGGATLFSSSATFTAIANRRYRITMQGRLHTPSASLTVFWTVTDGSTTYYIGGEAIATSGQQGVNLVWEGTISAGAKSINASANTSAGTISFGAGTDHPAILSVEDIGPASTAPAS